MPDNRLAPSGPTLGTTPFGPPSLVRFPAGVDQTLAIGVETAVTGSAQGASSPAGARKVAVEFALNASQAAAAGVHTVWDVYRRFTPTGGVATPWAIVASASRAVNADADTNVGLTLGFVDDYTDVGGLVEYELRGTPAINAAMVKGDASQVSLQVY